MKFTIRDRRGSLQIRINNLLRLVVKVNDHLVRERNDLRAANNRNAGRGVNEVVGSCPARPWFDR